MGGHRLRTGTSWVLALLLATGWSLLGAGGGSIAAAAGTPDITLTERAATTVLYGQTSPITLTTHNPTSTNGYNLSFVDVLPAGVSFVAGSTDPVAAGAPRVLADQPSAGRTTLIWSDVADLQAGSASTLTFRVRGAVEPATDALLPGTSYTDDAAAYVSSDPRTSVAFAADGTASSYSGSAATAATTTINPLSVTKSVDQPENELPRGVHDHKAEYTLTVQNSAEHPTDAVTVDDWLPAGLEFLGCGGVDHTTDAPTDPGSTVEYPGAPALTAGRTLAASSCPTPALVETVRLAPAGGAGSAPAQPLQPGTSVYTHVRWDVGALAAGASVTVHYLAGVPLQENGAFPGPAPAAAGGGQGSDLDNNSGPETVDGQALTNLALAGGDYTGPVADGTDSHVTASTEQTVEAVDLAVQKTVDDATFSQGSVHTWTLHYQTSEYRYATDVVFTDTLPNGLCPLGSVDHDRQGDPQCAPQDGQEPNPAYSSVVDHDAAGFTLTWHLAGAVPADTDATITFPALDRSTYQTPGGAGDETAAGDALTNHVTVTGTTAAVCTDGTAVDSTCATATTAVWPAETTPGHPENDSRAAETTGTTTVVKRVAAAPAAGPAGSVDCTSATYVAEPIEPTYTRGDTICFELTVDFAGGASNRNPVVTDLLPPNSAYVPGSAAYLPDSTVTPAAADGSSPGLVSWTLADSTVGGVRFVAPGAVFHVVLAVTADADPAAGHAFDIVANLLKVTQQDTSGATVSLRSAASYHLAQPLIGVTHGVAQVDGGPGNPADTDHVQVTDGSTVTYRVDLTNTGGAPATGLGVTVALPARITTCAEVSALSDGGTCTVDGGIVSVHWVALPDVLAAGTGTKELTYVVTLPDAAAPGAPAAGEDLSSTATVTGYRTTPNDGGTPATYVPGQDGVPPATDPTDVFLPPVGLVKTRTTTVTEAGNDGPDQATVGEGVTYTVVTTVPAHTAIHGGVLTDPLGPRSTVDPTTVTFSVTPTVPDTGGFAVSSDDNAPTLTFPAQLAAGDDPVVVALTFTATVTDVGANTAGAALVNRATLNAADAAGAPRPPLAATAATTLVEPAPQVVKTDDVHHAAAPGAVVGYTVTVSNPAGPAVSTAHALTAVDTLPVGMGEPTDVSDAGAVTGSASQGWVITWTVDSLAPDASVVRTYRAALPAEATALETFTNDVTVTAASLAVGPGTGAARTSYAASAADAVRAPGAAVAKSADPRSVTIGQDTVYTAVVTVPADVRLPDATAIDTLPDGLVFDGYATTACTGADGSACGPDVVDRPLPTPTRAADGTTRVAWFLGDLAADSQERTITLTYTGRPAPARAGGAAVTAGAVLANAVGVSWQDVNGPDPATIPDPAGYAHAADRSVAPVTVVEPLVRLAKAASVSRPVPGQPITYTVTATNRGTSPAFDLVLTDPLPAGLTAPTAVSDGGTYTASTRTLRWTVPGPLAVGASVTRTYTQTLDSPADTAGAGLRDTAGTTWDGVAGGVAGDPGHARYRAYGPTTAAATVTPVLPAVTVAKTVADGTESGAARVGASFGWLVTVADTTAAPASGVVVTDTLPAGWTYDPGSATAAGAPITATRSGRVLTFAAIATVAQGTPVTIGFTATPGPTASLGEASPDVNSAAAVFTDATGSTSSKTGPYRAAPDTAQAVIAAADLSATKTALGPVVPGAPSVWRVTVADAGPSDSGTPLRVADTLPAGSTAVSCSPGWTTTLPGDGTVTCTRTAPLAAGATTHVDVTLTVPAGTGVAGDPATVTNTAAVSGPLHDPDPGNDHATATAPLSPRADLSLAKTHAGPVVAGQPATYDLTVVDRGPSDAAGPVTVVDTLPAGLTWVGGAGGDARGAWTCAAAGRTVTCRLPAGLVLTAADPVAPELTITVAVGSDVTGTVANTATVSAPTPDPVPGNDTATDPTPVTAAADLTITKTHAGAFTAGTDADYRLAVADLGPSDASGVTVTDPLPDGLTFVSGTGADPGSGSSWSCTADAAQLVTCVLSGPLPAGVAAPAVLLRVAVGAGVTTALRNTATVGSDTRDPDHADDASTDDSGTPVADADLSLAKTAVTPTVDAGDTVAWDLAVHDHGPADAAGPVVVTDTLPAGTTFLSGDGGSGTAAWTCAADGPTVTCTRPAGLAAGADAAVLRLTARVDPDREPGVLTNRAGVRSSTPDGEPLDDAATATVRVTDAADLSVVKRHQGAFTPGAPGSYTVEVANAGPSAARDIVVTDALPDGETFLAAAADPVGAARWSCAADPSQVVRCTLSGPLPAGADTTITLTVAVAPGFTGATLANTASAASSTPDPGGPPSGTDTVAAVDPEADLAITKTHTGTASAGGHLTSVLVVHDAGPSDAAGPITVTDVLPEGTAFVSATGATDSGWTCSGVDAPTVTCELPAGLAAGADAPPIRVVSAISAAVPAGTPLVNRATVSSPTPDPAPADDATTDTAVVRAVTDLAVTKTHVGSLVAGQPGEYRLTVVDAGPADAAGPVVVRDDLPAGLRFVSVASPPADPGAPAGSDWVCTGPSGTAGSGRGAVTCSLAAGLAAGATAPVITVVVDVLPAAYPAVTNTAAVSSPTTDLDPADDTATDTAAVGATTDLTVTKTHRVDGVTGADAAAGGTLDYLLTVTDSGLTADPGPVTVTDPLPDGITYVGGPAADTGWTCRPTTAGTPAATVLTCTSGRPLAAGAHSTFGIATAVGAAAVPAVVNLVGVGSAADLHPGATGLDTAGVAPVAALTITKTALAATVRPGGELTWRVTVVNRGPSATSTPVSFTDPIAADLTWVGATGRGWACTERARLVTCARDAAAPALTAGAAASVDLLTRVSPDAGPGQAVVNSVRLGSSAIGSTARATVEDRRIVRPAPTPTTFAGSSPTASPTVTAPSASAPSASVPSASAPPVGGTPTATAGPTTAPGGLPKTGADLAIPLGIAAVLVILGAFLRFTGRRPG